MNNYIEIKAADKRGRITRRKEKGKRENKTERGLKNREHFVGFADKADRRLSVWRAK